MMAKDLRTLLAARGWWGKQMETDPQTGARELVQLGLRVPTRKGAIYRLFDTSTDPSEVRDVAPRHDHQVGGGEGVAVQDHVRVRAHAQRW